MDFETDNVEAGPRKNFDHAAGTNVRKFEIVRLNQDERFLDLGFVRETNRFVQHAAVAIGKFRPEFQVALDCLCIERGDNSGLEISHLA